MSKRCSSQVYRDVLASWLDGEEGQVALDQPLVTNPSCRAWDLLPFPTIKCWICWCVKMIKAIDQPLVTNLLFSLKKVWNNIKQTSGTEGSGLFCPYLKETWWWLWWGRTTALCIEASSDLKSKFGSLYFKKDKFLTASVLPKLIYVGLDLSAALLKIVHQHSCQRLTPAHGCRFQHFYLP